MRLLRLLGLQDFQFQDSLLEFLEDVLYLFNFIGSVCVAAAEGVTTVHFTFECAVKGSNDAVRALRIVACFDAVNRARMWRLLPIFDALQEIVEDSTPGHSHRALNEIGRAHV